MSKFEIIRGVKDWCLALDDIIHAWESDEEYKAVDTQSRWHELFGTPERAARTMSGKCGDCCECVIPEYCNKDNCLLFDEGDYDALLEWLRGDA